MRIAAVTLITALVMWAMPHALAQQPLTADLHASLLLPEPTSQRSVLLRIRNSTEVAITVCIKSVSYDIGGTSRGMAMSHRCITDTNFVVVLPGESQVIDTGISADIDTMKDLSVSATATVRSVMGSPTNTELRIHWKGSAEEARDAFRRIIGRAAASPNP